MSRITEIQELTGIFSTLEVGEGCSFGTPNNRVSFWAHRGLDTDLKTPLTIVRVVRRAGRGRWLQDSVDIADNGQLRGSRRLTATRDQITPTDETPALNEVLQAVREVLSKQVQPSTPAAIAA